MNTTPKQQDDEGIAAADGSRPSLETTVLGVAPPASGVAPAGAPPPVGAGADVASRTEPAASGSSAIAVVPMIAVADPPPVSDSPPLAEPRPLSEPRPVSEPRRVAAGTRDVAHASGVVEPARDAPPRDAPPRDAPPRDAREPQPSPVDPAPNGVPGLGHTALSEDYLRAAREAALAQVAARAHETDGSRDGSAPTATHRATPPTPAPEPPPAVPVSPTLPAVAEGDVLEAPWQEEADAVPPSVRTFRSLAPPALNQTSPLVERRPPEGGRGFEPVPVVRAPLAESLSGALSPIVELGGYRHQPPSLRPPPPAPRRDGVGRWLLLASVALATVGVVTFGSRLLDRYRDPAPRAGAEGAELVGARTDAPASFASRALMPDRTERRSDGRPQVVWATGAAGAAGAEAASASPESQLAATAGRHVLSGNYAEALPLYRQLESRWPENTAYAAMARLLSKRVGSANDTRSISPTTPEPARPR